MACTSLSPSMRCRSALAWDGDRKAGGKYRENAHRIRSRQFWGDTENLRSLPGAELGEVRLNVGTMFG